MNHEVYLHGQIPETHSFLLKGEIVRFASARPKEPIFLTNGLLQLP